MKILESKHITLLFLLFFQSLSNTSGQSETYRDPNAPVADRVEDVLSRMTLEEKLDYIGGYNAFYVRAIPRLGLPQLKMSDGPVGIRNYGPTTAYPAGICSAATWDTALIRHLGHSLGNDARARGVHILLAPGVNIYRAPMCGRNFEYFGEDPFLAGRIAAAYVTGVQEKGVVTTVKHYAGNNQEWNRNWVSSDIDERTLHEIYLPAFRAAVTEAGTGAIMTAYNLVNGIYCSHHDYLLNDVLKTHWHFDGIAMSDWGATHDGIEAANGGLDLEMPSGYYMNRYTLLAAIVSGKLDISTIDDKVRRMLRILFRFGFYDHPQTDQSIPLDNPENVQTALDIARGGITLLKNQNNLLPVSADSLLSIALIGDNGKSCPAGGGSSYTSPFSYTSLYEGLNDAINENIRLTYNVGTGASDIIFDSSIFYTQPGSQDKGLTGEYFSNMQLTGQPFLTRRDEQVNFYWEGQTGITGFPGDQFSIRWTGVIVPEKDGDYEFVVKGDDGYRLYLNDSLVIDEWRDQAVKTTKKAVELEAGKEYTIELHYYENGGIAEIRFGYRFIDNEFSDAVKLADSSDIVIISAGFNSSTEGEGWDRSFTLPDNQNVLIKKVAQVNPNTIVILYAGGNMDMSDWIDDINALIHAWYPGQEGGQALAEIIFGSVNPSGKLPATFEKTFEDNPVYNSYYDTDGDNRVTYSEELFMGYRGYDFYETEPLFPFGFGLSYTTFDYANLRIETEFTPDKQIVTVYADITNTGEMEGAEVVQLYVRDISSSLPRPVKELKGFSKVTLKPGETKTAEFVLNFDSWRYYNPNIDSWVFEEGEFEIMLGTSSKDIKLSDAIYLEDKTKPSVIWYNPEPASKIADPHDFQLYFSEPVTFQNKNISVYEYDTDILVETISGSSVKGSGTQLITLSIQDTLSGGVKYYITIEPWGFVDAYNNYFDGITAKDAWYFTLNNPAYNNGSDENSRVKLYPVPVSENLTIMCKISAPTDISLKISTIPGNVVEGLLYRNDSDGIINYNCSKLNTGLYICKIQYEGKVYTQKLIVCR